jgi:hypothetical protein
MKTSSACEHCRHLITLRAGPIQVADLQRLVQQGEAERALLQEEVTRAQQLAEKHESDLRSLSNAYNTLEQVRVFDLPTCLKLAPSTSSCWTPGLCHL